MQDEIEDSFHGKLLKVVIEHWASESLFEQNDMQLRNKLTDTLKKYLPNIQIELNWNMDPHIIDKCAIAGDISFIDESDKPRILNFYITATGANIQ